MNILLNALMVQSLRVYQVQCLNEPPVRASIIQKFSGLELLQIVIFIADAQKIFTNTLDNTSLTRSLQNFWLRT